MGETAVLAVPAAALRPEPAEVATAAIVVWRALLVLLVHGGWGIQ